MRHVNALAVALLVASCVQKSTDYTSLTDAQKRSAEFSLSSMKMAPGLEVSLFAHEPMLVNPTNIDIDHKGRVWVCEGYNYRLPSNPDKVSKPEGDRILILEDTDLDGKADKQTVFYQGKDVNAALGISVLGEKVFVSKSPNILVFTDSDGDDRPESKEILFAGMDGADHDHGIHAVVFGPDGKLYFNAGNEFHQMTYPDGSPVVDLAGNQVNDSGDPYRQGMAFRCDLDGSNLETLGWNFRNPYELALDSYGNIWQSDNDDDGNRGTRLNLVVEFGNYGFTDEMTGAGWRTKRTGMAEEIPQRHWHLRDPGVVPNLLQLYAGSPTGILYYQGNLLPGYQNTLIHAEAGANVIHSYPIEKEGYGYRSRINDLMKAADDPWFRPSDVCVAPDGSVLVADWYDPGVGGHLVGDQQRGRIFRIAPAGINYTVPQHDFQTIPGLIGALKNPNQAIRYLAWKGLKAQGAQAKPALLELFDGNNPELSARALWLLAELDAEEAFELGKNSQNQDLQITAIKMARQKLQSNLLDYLRTFDKNAGPQVQRELAVALRFLRTNEAARFWVQLASNYKGDRWFLEALGIGSDLNAEACFNAWLQQVGTDWKNGSNKDIVWRTRSATALPLLAELILESDEVAETHRYFRAFDFHQSEAKNETIESILKETQQNGKFQDLAFKHLDRQYVMNSPELKKQLLNVIENYRGTEDFIWTIQKYKLKQFNDDLLAMVLQNDPNGPSAARLLLENEPELFTQVLQGNDEQKISSAIAVLGSTGNDQALNMLQQYMLDHNNPLALRQQAAQHFATSWHGQNRMLVLLTENKLPAELIQSAAGSLSESWRPGIRQEATKYLDIPDHQNRGQLPSISELVALEGDRVAGALVFEKLCQSCHVVNGVGTDFGPSLSEIGSKLSKEAMYASILKPDAGISFGYEGYLITLEDGSKITGLIQSRTPEEIIVKQLGGAATVYNADQVQSIEQLGTSLMTPNLHLLMDQKELVDLVTYMDNLESPSR